MLKPGFGVALVAEQDNVVLTDTGLFRGFLGNGQNSRLSREDLCTGVF